MLVGRDDALFDGAKRLFNSELRVRLLEEFAQRRRFVLADVSEAPAACRKRLRDLTIGVLRCMGVLLGEPRMFG